MRMGIIGLGWVASDYAVPAIMGTDGLQLIAAADPLGAGGIACKAYGTHRKMLEKEHLDAVYIASPNHLHKDHTVDALNAGCHVLCEKPLAINSEDAAAMAAAAETADRLLVAAFDQRYHPAHQAMAAMVRAGRVGRITQVRIDYACWVAENFLPDNWRIEACRAGGGAVIDLAPHGLDLTEMLTGEVLEELQVLRQRRVHLYAVDDGGALIGRTGGGVLLSHTVSYNRHEALPRRRLEVIGTEGTLLATDTMGQTPGGTLEFLDCGGQVSAVGFAKTSPFTGQFAAFAKQCAEGRAERSAHEDVRLVKLLEHAFSKEPGWR